MTAFARLREIAQCAAAASAHVPTPAAAMAPGEREALDYIAPFKGDLRLAYEKALRRYIETYGPPPGGEVFKPSYTRWSDTSESLGCTTPDEVVTCDNPRAWLCMGALGQHDGRCPHGCHEDEFEAMRVERQAREAERFAQAKAARVARDRAEAEEMQRVRDRRARGEPEPEFRAPGEEAASVRELLARMAAREDVARSREVRGFPPHRR
jgi:hypothetical protein